MYFSFLKKVKSVTYLIFFKKRQELAKLTTKEQFFWTLVSLKEDIQGVNDHATKKTVQEGVPSITIDSSPRPRTYLHYKVLITNLVPREKPWERG